MKRLLPSGEKLSPKVTDEGRVWSGTPFTGNYGKAAPHPALRATFPHGGRLTTT